MQTHTPEPRLMPDGDAWCMRTGERCYRLPERCCDPCTRKPTVKVVLTVEGSSLSWGLDPTDSVTDRFTARLMFQGFGIPGEEALAELSALRRLVVERPDVVASLPEGGW